MFLFAVAIFFFHSMYSSFSSSSVFSKRIHDRQVAPATELIAYHDDGSTLSILKQNKSSSIYCGTKSDVHRQINNFSNLKVPDEMNKDNQNVIVFDTKSDGIENNEVRLELTNDTALLIFSKKNSKKNTKKQDHENKDLAHDKKEAETRALLRNRAHLTAAAIRVIVSRGIFPAIVFETPVDKDFYIENILNVLPAGTPLKFRKNEGYTLSFCEKDFDAFARIALSKDEQINVETFVSVFSLLNLDSMIFKDVETDDYYTTLNQMAQKLKKKGLTVEPILKEFFKVVYTKKYRNKIDKEALDQLIDDAKSATDNAADVEKEKLKKMENDNEFTKRIPQKEGVVRNLFNWGIFIGKYAVSLYGLTHMIFVFRSKFKR